MRSKFLEYIRLLANLFSIFPLTLICSQLFAAEVTLLNGQDGNSIIFINGEIIDGDAQRFCDISDHVRSATVFLESDGGLINDALEIGARIRQLNYSTMVENGKGCYSACALIWIAGTERYVSHGSLIGMHAAFLITDGIASESGVANAEIGSYLTTLGLRIEAIRYFTTASPDRLLYLTPEIARGLGIEISVLDGEDGGYPEQSATVDDLAKAFTRYATLANSCSEYFAIPSDFTDQQIRLVAEEGQPLAGSDMWIELWMRELDQIKSDLRNNGTVQTCLNVETSLRTEGMPTGIDSPSFTCPPGETETELTLCLNSGLMAKDRLMSTVYFKMRNTFNDADRSRLITFQREWSSRRNECESDVSCLNDIYDYWFEQFQAVVDD